MINSVRVLESRFLQSCTSIANAPQILSAEIAILGRSNVGKSSLINALLNNKNLAKSSSAPGKTRLVNFFETKWEVVSDDLPCACGNLSLELHSADLANFGRSQTTSLASHPKFAKNHESQTENPSVVLNVESKNNPSLRESANAESKQSTTESSLRGRIIDSPEAIQKNKINPARSVNPNKSFCYFWLIPKVESSLPYQPKSTQKGKFADSTNPLPLNSLVSFRKKGCTPLPAPPTRQKAAAFSLLGGEPRNSDSSKKSAGGTTAPLIPDFLHHESGEIRGADAQLFCVDCHESAIADSRNDEFFANHHESSAILLRYAPIDFTPQKICKKEYFLQIKDKYEFGDGFVIYVVFGAYYAPNSAYIIVRKNSEYCEILGDIIPTKANLSALNELQFLGVRLDN